MRSWCLMFHKVKRSVWAKKMGFLDLIQTNHIKPPRSEGQGSLQAPSTAVRHSSTTFQTLSVASMNSFGFGPFCRWKQQFVIQIIFISSQYHCWFGKHFETIACDQKHIQNSTWNKTSPLLEGSEAALGRFAFGGRIGHGQIQGQGTRVLGFVHGGLVLYKNSCLKHVCLETFLFFWDAFWNQLCVMWWFGLVVWCFRNLVVSENNEHFYYFLILKRTAD